MVKLFYHMVGDNYSTTPFDFYESLSDYFYSKNYHYASHKKTTLEGFLADYMETLK